MSATPGPLQAASKPAPATPTGQSALRTPHSALRNATDAPLRSVGPDAYGYVVSDSNEPGGPPFGYVAATHNLPALNGDDLTQTVSLPFSVTVYGQAVPNLTIDDNGLLYTAPTFCNTHTCYNNTSLPNNMAPPGTIAPFWDDLILTDTLSGIYTDVLGIAPTRSYIVEWRNADFYNDLNSHATFEVIFHENSNQIDFEYASLSGSLGGGASATVGIQNIAQNIGLDYSNDEPALTQGTAVRFLALVTPGDQSAANTACAGVNYTGQIINPNAVSTVYTLTLSDSNPAYHSVVTPTNTGPIPAGASVPFTVTVNIPAGAPGGTSDVTTLLVASTDQNYPVSERVHLTTLPGAEFIPASGSKNGSEGATLTYSTTLYNLTGATTGFTLTTGSVWQSSVVPANTGPLPPAAGVAVTVSLTIPQNAQPGESDTVAVTATAQLSSTCTIFGTAAFTGFAGNVVTRQNLPAARARHAQVDFPLNGRAYILGGAGTDGGLNLPILEYDSRADSWTARRTLLQGVSNVGAAVLGDVIYLPGGFDGTGATNIVQTYRPATDGAAILTSDPLPAPRYGAAVAAVGGKMYVIGGSDGITVTHTVYEFDPALAPGSRWARKADMPTARSFLAAAALDGRIYAIGGLNVGANDIATVEVYDPAGNSWTSAPSLPVAAGGTAAIGLDSGQPCGGYVYVYGGGFYSPVATTERFDPVANAWTVGAPLSVARRTLAASYVTNSHLLLITGGFNGIALPTVDAAACGGVLPTPTATPLGGAPTFTPLPATPTFTPLPATATPTVCGGTFSDVHPSDYFYTPVEYLACRNVVSGYSDGTFRPYANMTRAQLCKVVVLAQGWPLLDPATPHFSDVPPAHPFYQVIETAYAHGIISGYSDGTFAPYNNVTRGQIAKIVVLARGWPLLNPSTAHFSDVPIGSTFYQVIETAYAHGIISGYSDGTFRPNTPATRGQVSKIVYLAVTGP
ncbi:MAG: S-layer homology domain-containing protein [Chloroflexia bacterium]